MSRRLGILASLALVVAAVGSAGANPAGAAPAAPRIKVAIVPGVAVSMEPARVDALAQDLAAALSQELDVDAEGGLEVRRALPPEGVPPDCAATPACVADVAKRTGATQLLFVVMVDSGAGGSIQIDTTWVEPATAQQLPRPAVDITSVGEARTRFAAAARSLLPDAPLRPKQKSKVDVDVNVHSAGGEPRHMTSPALITAGIAIVGVGVGVGFGLATRSKYNSCDSDPAACSQGQRDTIRHFGLVADSGWILGIGGAVATSLIFATSGESPHFVVAPMSNGAAVSAFGRF